MSILNVVKWACGAVVVCLGMSVNAMEKSATDENDTKSYRVLDVAEMLKERPGRARLSETLYNKYERNGFAAWKEDLFKFISKDFQDKLHSSNKEDRLQAFDEVTGWTCASSSFVMFGGMWGENSEIRARVSQALEEAKALAEQYEDPFLVNEIKATISNCNVDPIVDDE